MNTARAACLALASELEIDADRVRAIVYTDPYFQLEAYLRLTRRGKKRLWISVGEGGDTPAKAFAAARGLVRVVRGTDLAFITD